jgi:hypothetical protein
MNRLLIRIFLPALILCWTSWAVRGQPSWVAAGNPLLTLQMRDIYTDTVTDAIYFCGQMSFDGDFNFTEQGIPYYSNGQWDTIGPLIAQSMCLIRWGDTLVLGGSIVFIDSVPYQNCAGLANGEWIQFGNFSSTPAEFRIIGGTLYAIGPFDQVDGQVCNGIAKRVGGHWVPVGNQATLPQNYVSDLVIYNGHLVLAGTMSYTDPPSRCLAILNDSIWEPLGPGILGGFGAGRSLAVYQGDLYVGGAIHIYDGNAGHGIMRWDGSQFHPVGSGLQGNENDYSDHCGVTKMVVRDGLLYCAGQFHYAGNIPAKGMATWDGTEWCGFGGDLELPVESFDFYHDTLFVGPNDDADGMDVESAAKYVGTYPDTCTQNTTAAPDRPAHAQPFQVSVRSAGDLYVSGIGVPCGYSIHSADGRVVHQGRLNGAGGGTVHVSLPPMAAGPYVFRCPFGAAAFFRH